MTPAEHTAALRELTFPPQPEPAAREVGRPAAAPHEQERGLEPEEEGGVATWLPGPLVRKLLLVAALAVLAAGALAGWLVSRAAEHEAMQRLVVQQEDEVELVARLLASKIEQSQKVLATVAEGITPSMLESPASLEWLLQQGLPAVRFFDAMQVARPDGQLSVNLRYGQLGKASELDPAERDYLVRTLVNGKPLVSELIGTTAADARVMFTQPLLRGEGRVNGAVAGVLRLQSQGLLPHSLALPARPDSRMVVFTREGVILSHPDVERVLGHVRDEPGLAEAYERWRSRGKPLAGASLTELRSGHVVSLASVPMPQWMVARVSDAHTLLAPVEGAQRRAWQTAALATVLLGLAAVLAMAWLARPLAQLRQRAMAALETPPASGQDGAELADVGPRDWPRSRGEVDDVVHVCMRLLEHRRAHQRGWQALSQQLQAVLAHVPLGIIVTHEESVQVASLQACHLLDYTPAQLHGRGLQELLAPQDGRGDSLARQVGLQFAAHGRFEGELSLLRGDGGVQWVRAQGRPMHEQDPQRGTVWVLEDCTAMRATRQQPAWRDEHDALTLLPHRAAFEARLHNLLAARAARPPLPAADAAPGLYGEEGSGVLLFLDLDHFTVINDVAGHEAGDDVLCHLARLLESEVRQMGWAARLGGDEFAVLLPGVTPARGHAVAEQLRAAVQAWEPSYQGRSFTLGLSIGLVPLSPGLRDVALLLHTADMACYAAKRAGRNRVEVRRVMPQPELEGLRP
ncbi:diguanylate cyclase domain-containing protein [Melaminivora sp.]|uniref:sensor domain-containing diguanylate cyclase n=1 Tax=Melaminivora sp. TaxID=1933032 RepID=UPI0039185C2D